MIGKNAVGKATPNAAFPQSTRLEPTALLFILAFICLTAICWIVFWHGLRPASEWPQGWLNPFDACIVRYVNHFADRWHWLNSSAYVLEHQNLLKTGPIVLLYWVMFFSRSGSAEEVVERRRKIAAIVPLAFFGVILARVFAAVLPFRERPLRTSALHFQIPHVTKATALYGWSSFPSDHAVLFVTLAIGLLIISRILGIIALVNTFGVVFLVRTYLGLHWPTDLLAGAALGAGLACIALVEAYRNFVWRLATRCWHSSPGIFAAFIFVLSYETINLFQYPLAIAKTLLKHRP